LYFQYLHTDICEETETLKSFYYRQAIELAHLLSLFSHSSLNLFFFLSFNGFSTEERQRMGA